MYNFNKFILTESKLEKYKFIRIKNKQNILKN